MKFNHSTLQIKSLTESHLLGQYLGIALFPKLYSGIALAGGQYKTCFPQRAYDLPTQSFTYAK